MFVRQGISAEDVFWSSWRPVFFAGCWAITIIYLHSNLGLKFVILPALPISMIGIAISLYLGFKTTSAYNRWWEARQIWGSIINDSRTWANQTHNLLSLPGRADASTKEAHALIRRHLAWVNALAFQLRKTSRLAAADKRHIFDFRNTDSDATATGSPECYERYLPDEEVQYLRTVANPATHIVKKQGEALRALQKRKALDNNRMVEMMQVLGRFYDYQGACERIKNTPFPRQITYFGRAFSWMFIALLPLALYDSFESAFKEHARIDSVADIDMLPMVLFTMVISWLFYVLQKVSESCEDPFEGGPTDVPISALTRVIEIDLLQMLGEEDIPEPAQPIHDVLY